MVKKLTMASLVLILLLGTAGCRLPLIDPPIVGRWLVITGFPVGTYYWTFNRDHTGKEDVILGGGFSYENDFSWSYARFDHILTRNGQDFRVEYNFFRTHAVLYNPSNGDKLFELELLSTPLFRL